MRSTATNPQSRLEKRRGLLVSASAKAHLPRICTRGTWRGHCTQTQSRILARVADNAHSLLFREVEKVNRRRSGWLRALKHRAAILRLPLTAVAMRVTKHLPPLERSEETPPERTRVDVLLNYTFGAAF